MHDTAFAVVSPDGQPICAISLERISRIKQDGRTPESILKDFPWQNISKTAISVNKNYPLEDVDIGSGIDLLRDRLDAPQFADRGHSVEFFTRLNFIPTEKIFIPHHLSHAASSYWGSTFNKATCLVYDGGMANEDHFGGVYSASVSDGVSTCNLFSAVEKANITRLYTAVTVVLGFKPLKHEGKITGLAAYGKVSEELEAILKSWLYHPTKLSQLLHWVNAYSINEPPTLITFSELVKQLQDEIAQFSREDIAATVSVFSRRTRDGINTKPKIRTYLYG